MCLRWARGTIVLTYTMIPFGNHSAMLVLGFPLGFFASGVFSGMGAFYTENFPTRVRGVGQGFTYNVGRAVGALFPTLVGFLSARMPLGEAIGLFAGIALCAGPCGGSRVSSAGDQRQSSGCMKYFLISFAICVALAFGQDGVVFRSGVSLIRVDAEAVDPGGHIVSGLSKDDFRVLDEGKQQLLTNFSFEEEPLDLVLLFDTAGSMRGKLLNVVRATELGFNELHKGDRVCVRAYSGVSTEFLPFTDNLQAVNLAILTQVLKINFGGGSRLEPAADEAALRFRTETKTHRKRAILIVTDKPGVREPNEAAVVRDLWNSDAVLSELILAGAPQTKVDSGANGPVDKTGGATILAGNPGDAFRDSVHYIRSGYTMYYTLPDASPGSERKLEVDLTPEAAKRYPNVRIRARSGYIAP